MLQTEFAFSLPRGYVDSDGNLHRDGVMRLATALDEIAPTKDPRVQSNPNYLVIILLSRVITRLGSVEQINPKIVEGIFATDMAFLQEFYRRINEDGTANIKTVCPKCGYEHEVEDNNLGEV